jgi:hypothetical protein
MARAGVPLVIRFWVTSCERAADYYQRLLDLGVTSIH